LTGPSRPVDTHNFAVRRDLAELELAGLVFAQHYAVPLAYRVQREAKVLAQPRPDAAGVATVSAGELFLVLDIGGAWAWGRTDRPGTVGYVAVDALSAP